MATKLVFRQRHFVAPCQSRHWERLNMTNGVVAVWSIEPIALGIMMMLVGRERKRSVHSGSPGIG